MKKRIARRLKLKMTEKLPKNEQIEFREEQKDNVEKRKEKGNNQLVVGRDGRIQRKK